jgi:divalent metal cation (Fe/Co/Zn/Cd) transporter
MPRDTRMVFSVSVRFWKKTRTAMDKLFHRGLWLEYFTVGYNVAEAVLSITFGALAGSVALVGFGLDSIVESLSGGILIWRLKQHGKLSEVDEERIEKRAMRFVAVTFFILGLYVLYESVSKLVFADISEPSLAGILIAIASIIIMPPLTWQKMKVGKAIGSRALLADAKETLACSYLSGALLLGLGANYFFGFWQADPIVGLVVVFFLLHEGWEAWRESFETEEQEVD